MDTRPVFVREKGPWSDVPDARRRVMQANKCRDTGPEMAVRRLLHRQGYRFRLHRRDLPGRPDLVFPGRRAVIQVHGCFWHQHGAQDPACRDGRMPKTRPEYWVPKLARNVERDQQNEAKLRAMGWQVLVLWECEIERAENVLARAQAFLGPPGCAVRS
jgi:DNA mismatch endonuclease (patch repair protein)